MGLSRQEAILKYIVEEFVISAEPVGSNTLLKKYNLPFSSATIRNDMAELEAKGLLEKTHASSGRVPSSKGYKYYAEHIKKQAQETNIDDEFKKEFQMVLSKKSQSVEDVMQQSCEILSDMTNLAAVVLGPKSETEHLVSISTVLIAPNALTSILVTDRGYVENKTFMIHSEAEGNNISKCIEIINKRLTGTSIDTLSDKIESLKPLLTESIGQSSDLIIESLVEAFVHFAKERIQAYGSQRLLEIPEYGDDKSKLQSVMDLLNNPSKLVELVENGQTDENSDSSISISQDESDDVAVVSHDFQIGDLPVTKLAIVGPQRMDYKKVIGTLNYIAKELSNYFTNDDTHLSKPDNNNQRKKNQPNGRKQGKH